MDVKVKSCDVAIITAWKNRPDKIGKRFHTNKITYHNVDFIRGVATFKCPECGAKMSIVQKPNNPYEYYFRAKDGHKYKNCSYNHGNPDERSINFYDESEFEIDSIVNGIENKNDKEHPTPLDPPDTDFEEDSEDSNSDVNFRKKKRKISNLSKYYEAGTVLPLEHPFGNSNVGEFFITKRTIEAGTIVNYNGIHFFAGTSCKANDNNPNIITPDKILNDFKLIPNNVIHFVIACENLYGKRKESLYLVLYFRNKDLFYDIFLKTFKKINTEIKNGRKKYVMRVNVLNNLKEIYNDSGFRILSSEIKYHKQFKIEKIQKD